MRVHNCSQWFLRVVMESEPDEFANFPYRIRPDLRALFFRPSDAARLTQSGFLPEFWSTVEDKLETMFNVYHLLSPERLLVMASNLQQPMRGFEPGPQAFEIADEIHRNLVDSPPAAIRQALGTPQLNGIALDARMAGLFDMLLLNLTRVGSNFDLAANEIYDNQEILEVYDAMQNQHNEFAVIDMSSMTASEAVNLYQLFWNITRPDSEVWMQINALNDTLVSAFNSSYPAALHEGVRVWEFVLRRVTASFHLALMTMELVLFNSAKRVNTQRRIRFKRDRNGDGILRNFTTRCDAWLYGDQGEQFRHHPDSDTDIF